MIEMTKYGIIGNYNHTIDPKNRLFLPAKLKDIVGNRLFITRSPKKSLYLFTESGWERFVNQLQTNSYLDSSETMMFFVGNAMSLDVDAQGRITIPLNLRKIQSIGKDVTVVGKISRMEIWNTEDWNEYNENQTLAENISKVIEKKNDEFAILNENKND